MFSAQVWDSYGRLLYQSSPFEYAVTSVAWSPNGDLFAAGGFDTILLCDRMGWSHSKSPTKTGSLLSISWTSDGTQLAAAGGNGSVVFGQVGPRSKGGLQGNRAAVPHAHQSTMHAQQGTAAHSAVAWWCVLGPCWWMALQPGGGGWGWAGGEEEGKRWATEIVVAPALSVCGAEQKEASMHGVLVKGLQHTAGTHQQHTQHNTH